MKRHYPIALVLLACGGSQAESSNRAHGDSAFEPAPIATQADVTSADVEPAKAEPTDPSTAKQVAADSIEVRPTVRSAVDDTKREAADRQLDAGRKPARFFSFAGVQPGWNVAELGAGTGYTAELLARMVGSEGKVYAQNSKYILERFAEKPWSKRLRKPVMKNVVRVDREFDDPLPEEAQDLDAVFLILFYHDTVWMKTDRAAMNKAIFEHLRPGGYFVVVDHRARDGAELADVQTLHRIEETTLTSEVQEAGFVLDARTDLLAAPSDTRDWSASPSKAGEKRGQSDRFVLRFVKP